MLDKKQISKIIQTAIFEALSNIKTPELIDTSEGLFNSIEVTYRYVPLSTDENGKITFTIQNPRPNKWYIKNSPFLGYQPSDVDNKFKRLFDYASNSEEEIMHKLDIFLDYLAAHYQYYDLDDIKSFNDLPKKTRINIHMYRGLKDIRGTVQTLQTSDELNKAAQMLLREYNIAYDEHLTIKDVHFKYRFLE